MRNDVPRGLWEWLLLLSPAVEMMLVANLPERWAAYLVHGDEVPGLALDIINLGVVLVVCLCLGVWWCWRDPNWINRIVIGGGFGFILALANVVVGFAGCGISHALIGNP